MTISSEEENEDQSGEANLSDALDQIAKLNEQLTAAQLPLQAEFQRFLSTLEGCDFGSLESNTSVADAIRYLMLRLEVRVECPREGCSEPSLIRCRAAGHTLHGSFAFEHRRKGRVSTHAASTRLPALKLVSAIPHRGRKSTS